jgi:hypothetical protein
MGVFSADTLGACVFVPSYENTTNYTGCEDMVTAAQCSEVLTGTITMFVPEGNCSSVDIGTLPTTAGTCCINTGFDANTSFVANVTLCGFLDGLQYLPNITVNDSSCINCNNDADCATGGDCSASGVRVCNVEKQCQCIETTSTTTTTGGGGAAAGGDDGFMIATIVLGVILGLVCMLCMIMVILGAQHRDDDHHGGHPHPSHAADTLPGETTLLVGSGPLRRRVPIK